MKLLILGPYPVRNNGMSEYIGHYRDELVRRGHVVETERMYFWQNKIGNGRWLGLRQRLREDFDAILVQHTPTASGPLVLAFLRAARRLGKTVAVVGHEPPSIYAKHLPPWLRPLYHAYERAVFAGAALRIVHTDLHAAELRAVGVPDPIHVIPIPVYGGMPPSSEPIKRDSWGYYGMISPKKGLDLLLAAYQGLPPGSFPPLHILGGGAPGQEAYVESLRASLGAGFRDHIRFHGYVESQNLPAAMARIALMIFPYRWVSQSAALAQTCMYRIPYLAADLPYFAEFQKRHGCGELFRANSQESLLAALVQRNSKPMLPESQPFDALLRELSLEHCANELLRAIESVHASR